MPLSAALLVLALLTPLALARPAAANPGGHSCGTQRLYAPNSTYEANLRLVAARLTVKMVNASSSRTARAHAGAQQVAASAYCRRLPGVVNSSATCVACVARSFRDARRLCPYHRDAVVERGECRVAYHDTELMGAIVVEERESSQ